MQKLVNRMFFERITSSRCSTLFIASLPKWAKQASNEETSLDMNYIQQLLALCGFFFFLPAWFFIFFLHEADVT